MRRQLLTVVLAVGLLLSGGQPVAAQVFGPQNVSAASTGGACTAVANSCASFQTSAWTSVGITVQGTFSGTLTFEGTIDGTNWSALSVTDLGTQGSVLTTTGTGIYTVTNAGLLQIRARATSWVSGTANVSINKGWGEVRIWSPTVAFASLSTTAPNGSWVYCSNCTVATSPCTGASTGAMAFRVNGAWRCQ